MKKRLLALFLVLCTLCTALPALATAWNSAPAPTYGIIHGGALRMRTAPNTTSKIVDSYPNGTWLEITQVLQNGYYAVAAPDGRSGYVPQRYVSVDGCAVGAPAAVTGPAKYVNLRRGPSTKDGIIARINNGTQVEVLAYGDIFSQVRTASGIGYMSSGLLRFAGQSVWEETFVHSSNGGKVNLRMGPTTSAKLLGSYSPMTYAAILVRGAAWHKVAIGGQIGYMAAPYLDAPPVAQPVPTNATLQLLSSVPILVRPDSPARTLELWGQRTPEPSIVFVSELRVGNTGTKNRNKLPLQEPLTLYLQDNGALWWDSLIVEDVNFDGYMDFRILRSDRAYNLYYDYWLWQPHTGQFAYNPAFSAIEAEPSFDPVAKQISAHARDGAAHYEDFLYRVENGVPVLIERTTTDYDGPSVLNKVQYQRVGRGMQEVRRWTEHQ